MVRFARTRRLGLTVGLIASAVGGGAAPAATAITTSTSVPVAWVYALEELPNGDTRILERNGGGTPFLDVRVPPGGGPPKITRLPSDRAYAGSAVGRLLPDGGAILAFVARRSGTTSLEVIDRDHGAAAAPVTLSAPGGPISEPGMIASPSGAAAVSWVQRAGKRHVGYLALRGPGHGRFGTPFPVPGGGAGANVAFGGLYDDAGDGLFWHYREGRTPQLHLARIGRDGTLGPQILLQRDLHLIGLSSSIAADGTIAVAWMSRHEPAQSGVYAYDVQLAVLAPGASAPVLRTLGQIVENGPYWDDYAGIDTAVAGGRLVVATTAGEKGTAVRTWSLPLADPSAEPLTDRRDFGAWVDDLTLLGREDGTAELLTVAALDDDDAWGTRLLRTSAAADGRWGAPTELGFALDANLSIDAAAVRPGGGVSIVEYAEGELSLIERLVRTDS